MNSRTSCYLYGVMPASQAPPPARSRALEPGVGDPPRPVRSARYRQLAAVVSDVPAGYHPERGGLRSMRRDMRAHANVLNEIIATSTVLPFRFGIVFPDETTLIAAVLKPHGERFTRYLEQLEGAVELKLRALYVEARVLQEVVAENPRLAAGPQNRRQSYQAKLEVGRRVSAALQAKQQHDGRRLLEALRPVVRDVRLQAPGTELTVLKAALLVDRQTLPKFDEALARLAAAERQRMELDCVGPLPPYSFVDMSL